MTEVLNYIACRNRPDVRLETLSYMMACLGVRKSISVQGVSATSSSASVFLCWFHWTLPTARVEWGV